MSVLIEAMEKEVWETMPEDLSENIDWRGGGRVHNWRNHVPYRVRDAWSKMSVDERKIAWLYAQERADEEEWE